MVKVRMIGEKIEAILKKAIEEKVFPGCVVGIVNKNGETAIFPAGRFTYENDASLVSSETVYDTASITKSIPTASLALYLIDRGTLSLEDKMIRYLPEYQGSYRERITIKHLLTQTLQFSSPMSSLAHLSRKEIIDSLFHTKLRSVPGSTYHYANATSIFLGMVLEKVTGAPLDRVSEETFFKPLHMSQTTFHPKGNIPPTEITAQGVIQGVVHDESTRALLPMRVGSAGLFSNAPDLLRFLSVLIKGGEYGGMTFFSTPIIKSIYSEESFVSVPHFGLGWEISARWMGKISKNVFGKTGFTGCMIACDVEEGLGVAMLANSTYPHRPKTADAINGVRRSILTAIFS